MISTSSGMVMLSINSSIGHKAVTFMIECFFTWLAIHLADELMDSITIPLDVEIIACLFLFVIQRKKTFDHKGHGFMTDHKAQNLFRDFKQRAEAKG